MAPTSDRLREYLITEEPLRGVYAATLSDNSSPKEVSIGVTDRRLLCLSEDGTFLNIGYDSICAIRSQPRSTFTYRGNDYRLLLGVGTVLAVIGFLALVAFTSSPVVPILLLATVGALAATATLYWNRDGAELATLDDVEQRVAADFDVDVLRRVERKIPHNVDSRQVLLSVSCLATVLGFVGTVAFAGSPLVVLFSVPILGGIGLVDYARRHVDDLDGIEIVRERARNVRISTDDGRTVRLEIDPSADVDRELSRLASVGADDPVQTISARS